MMFKFIISLTIFLICSNLYAQNPEGNALDFGGINDTFYVNIQDDPSLDITTELTLEAWVYFRSHGGSWNVIIDKDYDQYGLYIRDDGVVNFYSIGSFGTISLDGITVLETDTWHHTAATYDSATGTARVYVNGHLDGETTGRYGNINISDGPLRIGDDFSNDTAFDGIIDEVRIWNMARDTTQIQRTLGAPLSPEYYLTADSNLVGYWPFEQTVVDTIPDLSSYNNFGILIGGDIVPTSLSQTSPMVTTDYQLEQNFPNPFNPDTQIRFTILAKDYVSLDVYNTIGQKVKSLINREMNAGFHQVSFNAQNLPGGVYFYKIKSGNFNQVRKMILLK